MLQLYKPLEFLFLVAAFTTLAENFLPQLMSLPKSIVQASGSRGSWVGGRVDVLVRRRCQLGGWVLVPARWQPGV